jgi:metal-responsive CopG/Arc/MetJ family transcriptional regulator
MAKKKRIGRPVTTGIRPSRSVRLPKEIEDGVNRYSKAHKISRSEAIRRLVEHALADVKP